MNEVKTMPKHKIYFLLITGVFVIIAGTLAWLYFFDEMPKKTLPRAKQVMIFNVSIVT